jgi:hypothetical protein
VDLASSFPARQAQAYHGQAVQERPGGAKPARPGGRGRRPWKTPLWAFQGRISTAMRSRPGWPRPGA